MAYGVDVYDANGVKLVGFDNPTVIIDDVARIQNTVVYDPPIITGFTVRFHDSLIKTYTQRQGVTRLVCIGYYDTIGAQINAAPYCMGWLVLEVA